jgi:hypothetical protein
MKSFFLLIFSLLFVSCSQGKVEVKSNNAGTEKLENVSIVRPVFSSDSAVKFIEEQCAFGPRVPGSKAHAECAEYLYEQLNAYCDVVKRQPFEAQLYNGGKMAGVNLIAQICPDLSPRVALFAHWDCRPFCDNDIEENWHKPVMGANDGASGVAVLLEVARQLKLSGDSIGVDIVFLDLEDYGQPSFEKGEKEDTWCLGSQYLSRNPYYPANYSSRPQWGILLDMVGGKSPEFGFDQVSFHFAESYLRRVWKNARNLGYSKSFVVKESGSILDDHYYLNLHAGIPTIDIIDFNQNRGFPDTWHTVRDTPENIDKQSLQMVGEVVLFSIRNGR